MTDDTKALGAECMYSCQNDYCREEVSYPEDMLKVWKGEPICEHCHDAEAGEDDPSWIDLPPFVPSWRGAIETLVADVERLRIEKQVEIDILVETGERAERYKAALMDARTFIRRDVEDPREAFRALDAIGKALQETD